MSTFDFPNCVCCCGGLLYPQWWQHRRQCSERSAEKKNGRSLTKWRWPSWVYFFHFNFFRIRGKHSEAIKMITMFGVFFAPSPIAIIFVFDEGTKKRLDFDKLAPWHCRIVKIEIPWWMRNRTEWNELTASRTCRMKSGLMANGENMQMLCNLA